MGIISKTINEIIYQHSVCLPAVPGLLGGGGQPLMQSYRAIAPNAYNPKSELFIKFSNQDKQNKIREVDLW